MTESACVVTSALILTAAISTFKCLCVVKLPLNEKNPQLFNVILMLPQPGDLCHTAGYKDHPLSGSGDYKTLIK